MTVRCGCGAGVGSCRWDCVFERASQSGAVAVAVAVTVTAAVAVGAGVVVRSVGAVMGPLARGPAELGDALAEGPGREALAPPPPPGGVPAPGDVGCEFLGEPERLLLQRRALNDHVIQSGGLLLSDRRRTGFLRVTNRARQRESDA